MSVEARLGVLDTGHDQVHHASEETILSVNSDTESGIRIPGTSSHCIDPTGPGAGGLASRRLSAGLLVTGVLAPGVGPTIARQEPNPIMRAVLRGGLVDKTALQADYLDELLKVGRRPGYPTVARAVYANLPSLIAARSRYPEVNAPIHLIYGEEDWSRPSDRQANRQLLPTAEFTQVSNASHFIALERPDVPADLLNAAA